MFIITTVAGGSYGYSGDNGAATSAALCNPRGVALDSSGTSFTAAKVFDHNQTRSHYFLPGNVYISDNSNQRIRKVTVSTGIITTIAGGGYISGDGGAATSAILNSPEGVAVDNSGNKFFKHVRRQRNSLHLARQRVHRGTI